jgi:hypothetical protein
MRLIPPYQTVISASDKGKYGAVVARQSAFFLSRLSAGTSFEFASNLSLDRPHPSSGTTLRQLLMDIKSTVYPEFPLFHSIDRARGSDSNITFTFLPENNSDARMYIAGLVPYLRDTQDPWFLRAFTEESKATHQTSIWDPITKQVSSTTDGWISNALASDDKFNFTDTPTASWFPANVQFDIPEATGGGGTPAMYRDQDSISTFHPHAQTAPTSAIAVEESKEGQNDPSQPHTGLDDPTVAEEDTPQMQSLHGSNSLRGRSVTFDPSVLNRNDDIMSRILDNNSRISALESHFSNMSMQFSEAIEEMRRQSVMQTHQQDTLNLPFKTSDPRESRRLRYA